MLSRGAKHDEGLREAGPIALAGLSAVTKDPDDQTLVRSRLMSRFDLRH
jgi:hypothetical protein